MKRGLAASLLFAILALVFACVATGINYWYQASDPIKIYFGLWHVCSKVSSLGTFACTSWRQDNNDSEVQWIHGCQAMMVLSVMFYAFGVALILLHVTVLVHTRQLIKLAGVFFCLGGACNCIALIVFAAKYKELALVKLLKTSNGKLHAGFGLAVASTVFGLLSGIVALSVKSNSYESI